MSQESVRLPWRATELLRKCHAEPPSEFEVDGSSSSISAILGVAFMSPQGAVLPAEARGPGAKHSPHLRPRRPGEVVPGARPPRPAEPYPRVEDIKLKVPTLRLAELRRSSSESFAVRIEREADVPLVVHGFNRRGTEQLSLLVEHLDALRKRDATEIHQGGDEAS